MLEGVGKQGVSCSGHDTSSLKDASCVLVIQTLLRMLSFIAQRTVPCEKGGIRTRPGQLLNLSTVFCTSATTNCAS